MKRIRTAIKRVVMAGYFHHWIPAWTVRATVWAFRLKHL